MGEPRWHPRRDPGDDLLRAAKKIPFYNLADATAFCVPICSGWPLRANFLNGELWGRTTDAWWGVVFSPMRRGFLG